MTQEKRSIGFSTPSKELQDSFDELQIELSKQKSNWESFIEMYDKISKIFANKKDKLDEHETLLDFIVMGNLHLTKIGMELIEIHNRLAKVEKLVKTK